LQAGQHEGQKAPVPAYLLPLLNAPGRSSFLTAPVFFLQ
jgi:hypothetical protein